MLTITRPKFLFGQVRDLAEPLTRFFDHYELDTFNLVETEEVIRLPIEGEKFPITLKDSFFEGIYEKTGGHPYFIYFFMHDLINIKRKGTYDWKFFDENFNSILKHLQKDKFENDINPLGENYIKILVEMAQKEDIVTPKEIKMKGISASGYLANLVEKQLVTQVGRGKI